MRKLVLVVAALALVGCGDDDTRMMMGRDTGPRDTGGGVDVGGGMDTGGGTDTGGGVDTGGGTDSGGMGGMCPPGACNLESNEGCAPGEGCYWGAAEAGADPAPICVAAGTAGTGASCTAPNDCQEGHLCQAGNCATVCCGGSDLNCNTAAGEMCLNLVDGDTGEPLGFGACVTPSGCSLTAQNCESGTDGCYPVGGDGATDCFPAGDAAPGEACRASNSCRAGSVCLADGNCAKICAIGGGEPSCDGEQVCNGLSGFEDAGVCVDPA